MTWLMRALLGPAIWAATFSAVYALHGAGCARGWPDIATPLGSLHLVAMLVAWLVGALCGALVIRWLPAGGGLQHRLPRAGAWIGLGATLVTLFPVLVASSC